MPQGTDAAGWAGSGAPLPAVVIEVPAEDATRGRWRNDNGRKWRALLDVFGYSELPVLITLDQDGRVLRVRPHIPNSDPAGIVTSAEDESQATADRFSQGN